MVEQINKNKRVWLVSSARAHNRWDIQLPQMHSQEDQGERRLAHSQRWRMGRPSEIVFWARETEQPRGYQNEASPSPLLPYGLETQTAQHILQRCWPATTCWGRPIGYWRPHHPQQELKRTALFTLRTGLSLWSVNGKEKMCSFIITIRNSRVPIGVNWFVQW